MVAPRPHPLDAAPPGHDRPLAHAPLPVLAETRIESAVARRLALDRLLETAGAAAAVTEADADETEIAEAAVGAAAAVDPVTADDLSR